MPMGSYYVVKVKFKAMSAGTITVEIEYADTHGPFETAQEAHDHVDVLRAGGAIPQYAQVKIVLVPETKANS